MCGWRTRYLGNGAKKPPAIAQPLRALLWRTGHHPSTFLLSPTTFLFPRSFPPPPPPAPFSHPSLRFPALVNSVSLPHKMATALGTHGHVTPPFPVPIFTALRKTCTGKSKGAAGQTKPTTPFSRPGTERKGRVLERKVKIRCTGGRHSK